MGESEPSKHGAEYEGLPGRTRQTVIHYTCYGCGLTFGAKAWRTVNVASDPELADLLSRGELNTLTCPACSASCLPNLPLVYHDPQARRFALLLPEAMRHQELETRPWTVTRVSHASRRRRARAHSTWKAGRRPRTADPKPLRRSRASA